MRHFIAVSALFALAACAAPAPRAAAPTSVPAPATAKADAPKVDAAKLEAALTLWPAADRRAIAAAVAAASRQGGAQPYATFDADGTLWSSDATESFIAYLETQGVLTPQSIDPALKVIPFLPGEGVYSYYQRLCAKDKAIGYPFSVQVFAGFPLAELRRHYAAMMKTEGSHVMVSSDDPAVAPRSEFVAIPKLFPQQAQLVKALGDNGVKVYIVTASPEELIRMLTCAPVSAPGCELGLPPEQIIGMNLLLRDGASGETTSSRLRLGHADKLFDAGLPLEKWETQRTTPLLLPPLTMFAGKVAAITGFIHPTQRPVLAAGDSASDLPMLFHCAGARVWVDHPYTKAGTLKSGLETYREQPGAAEGWVRGRWDMVK